MYEVLLGNFFNSDEPCKVFSNGITGGLITSYYGDIIANLIYNEDKLSINTLKIRSGFDEYLASVMVGGITAITSFYLDAFANNVLTSILFFTLVYGEDLLLNIENNINGAQIAFDTIAVVIILYLFGRNTRNSYEQHIIAEQSSTDLLPLLIINIYYALRSN